MDDVMADGTAVWTETGRPGEVDRSRREAHN